jgi:type III restriction enzyme
VSAAAPNGAHDQDDGAEPDDERIDVPTSTSNSVLAAQRKVFPKDKTERLREIVDTIGKVGKTGQHIQNIIAVAMLSEGWDARTVTHIMGLRAFTSQLLCEQVVGRGLRRTSMKLTLKQDCSRQNM